ncbi:MAG: VWA domain-containing protein [Alphaproteobacteria bacterium]
MRNPGRLFILVAIAIVAVFFGSKALYQWGSERGFDGQPAMSYEDSVDTLQGLLEDVDWGENFVSRVSTVSVETASLSDTLPEIGTFPLVVDVPAGGNVVAEIFVSTEKSGTGTDGWMAQAAEDFNAANNRLKNGKGAKIRIRKIASGTGYQFIASRKHQPDAYSPSNHLWVRMAESHGVAMRPIREKTVRNVAGIVMKTSVAEQLTQSYGTLSVPNIVNAVVQGNIATGYTNPYASSTGLNFLVTVLGTFANGDESNMLSPEVVSAFESFQRGIPFVALTTLQMRDSVRRDGSLDAFVMEYQTFVKTDELRSGFEFIPFGLLHDNPLYAVGNPGPDKLEALELFADFLERDKYRRLASDYGFNPSLDHEAPFEIPEGGTLVEAQRIWKEKKDAGRPIVAVFVSDVSGSMGGTRLSGLKRALRDGSSFIEPTNSIGLVQFNDDVDVVLPIRPFELLHKSAFHAAVTRMEAGGGTAMYDGIAVALSLLVKEVEKQPDAKPLLFVLTDGKTNEGMSFSRMSRVITGLRIPVYTIGFEADLDELGRLSSLVEAANLNAGEQDVRFKIGALLNSQM